jgi:Activator of Hsp90 ATPase homolog 1-like protein
VRFTLEAAPGGGTRVVFDYTGFAEVDEMFRIVTLGWAQMLLRLQRYLEGGEPVPFFSF